VIEKPRWFDLRESDTFRSIRKLVLCALATISERNLEGLTDSEIASQLPGNPPDLRLRLDVVLILESLLVQLLKECELGPFGSLQFPANIRVLNPLQRRASREEYSTEHLHCDAWSSAPSDSWNHLLYILAEPQCARLEMRETLPTDHALREYVGPYDKDLANQITDLREVPIPCRPGVFVTWPTYTPHRTNYGSDWVADGSGRGPYRISLDFRTRIGHPYLEDRSSPLRDFAATKMNSGGVYWAFPDSEFLSFSHKVAFENAFASRLSSEVLEKRSEYLRAHYRERINND